MIDLERHLNPSQLAAVTTTEGPLLVLAGAGSGKTRVIEYRVLHLVQNGVRPDSILLLTFTKKAAREMLSRASRHDPRCRNVEGGTFHSFAYRLLKKYARTMGLSEAFTVLDEGDAEEAIHRCATKRGFFDKEKRYPKKDTLRSLISMSVNKMAPLAEVLKKEYPHFMEYAGEIEQLRDDYAAYKIEKNYLDYDDLIVFQKLLLERDEVRERVTRKYRYVMVDEYQDTNRLQGDIARLLAGKDRNIMVVGDDAQSIYGFRGASHENIMDFPRHFPGCTVVKLEENYRSSQSVLDVANGILENMKDKYSKCLVSARGVEGERPRLLYFRDAYEEAGWVARMIKENLDNGVPLHHQCVLFRSLYLSIPLQSELSRRNIPYETYGGLKFYETAHVKDLMAHLKVMANPRDELAWNRVLMLIRKIGPKTAGAITDEIVRCGSLGEALAGVLPRYAKGHGYSGGLGQLTDVLGRCHGEDVTVGGKFDVSLDYYIPHLKDKYDDWHLRLNDLEALRQIAARYDTLEELLEDFAVEPPERGVWRIEPETKDEEKPLVLSTIHSAKGLEWDNVYLMGLTDGVLPVTFALDSEEDIEEEQRLFYVAVTRAKNRLFLTLHHEGARGGIYQFNRVSRFLDNPKILSLLDRSEAYRPGAAAAGYQTPAGDETDEGVSGYSKSALLRKVLDIYRR